VKLFASRTQLVSVSTAITMAIQCFIAGTLAAPVVLPNSESKLEQKNGVIDLRVADSGTKVTIQPHPPLSAIGVTADNG
jgi:hypothetical protein